MNRRLRIGPQLFPQIVPELLHLGEEALRFRLMLLGVVPPARSNSRRSSCWRLVRFIGVSTTISTNISPRAWPCSSVMPLDLSLICLPAWVPAGTVHASLPALDGGYLDLAAQGRRGHRDRHPADHVGALAAEQPVRCHGDEDVEVARLAAANRGLALAGEPDARAVLDPGGMLTARVFSRCRGPLPPHWRHGFLMTRPVPWQVGQVRSTVKKPCWRAPDRCRGSSGRSPARCRASPPRPPQTSHANGGRHTDLRLLAREGLFEGDRQVVA